MAFSALKAKVNDAVMKRLSDPATLNSVAVVGLFSALSAELMALGLTGNNPTFTISTAQAGTDPRGQTLVFSSVSYRVVNSKPDGMGFTTLELEEL